MIDWDVYESAHRTLSPGQKTAMIKFRTRWIATRARLALLQESLTDSCPFCETNREIWDHVLQFPCITGLQAEFFLSIQKRMRANHTPLKLHLMVVQELQKFLGLPITRRFLMIPPLVSTNNKSGGAICSVALQLLCYVSTLTAIFLGTRM